MKGALITINEIDLNNTFEMTKFVLRIITITKNLYLSETELQALTHFVIDGYSQVTKEQLVENKLFKAIKSVYNTISQLKKYGIIVKTNYGEKINDEYNIKLSDIEKLKLEIILTK
jgi:CII-binding regulator of phage lambda lysogenization HflD